MNNGRVALVTGGARGLGQAIAIRLASDGHAVAVADIRNAGETVNLISEAGGRAEGFNCDITSGNRVSALAEEINGSLGPVDVPVANAGVYPVVPFRETTWEIWRRVMDVNVDGVFHVVRTFLPGMVERSWGRVIVLASGVLYMPPPSFSAYVASKGAVIGLVRGLAQEVGVSGVTVNCIAPSIMPTPGAAEGPPREMGLFDIVLQGQAIKRTAQPEDAAKAASFLASDDADFVTAQVLAPDGGLINV